MGTVDMGDFPQTVLQTFAQRTAQGGAERDALNCPGCKREILSSGLVGSAAATVLFSRTVCIAWDVAPAFG